MAQLFCNREQVAGEGKIILHIARILSVTDRESSVLNVTRESLLESSGQTANMSLPFTKLENVDIRVDKIIASPGEISRDIIELVHNSNLNIVFFPWQNSETNDEELDIQSTVSVLFHGSPATTVVVVTSSTRSVQGSGQGKILVPFFGGPNDREAIFLALSFSKNAAVVIATFSNAPSESSESSEVHSNANALTAEDRVLLKELKDFSEKENSNITIINKKIGEQKPIITELNEEIDNNYSLVIIGNRFIDGFEENNKSRVIGSVGSVLIERRQLPSTLLVVNKSIKSPHYVTGLSIQFECS